MKSIGLVIAVLIFLSKKSIFASYDIFANYKILYMLDNFESQEAYPKSCQELYDQFDITTGWYYISQDGIIAKKVLCVFEGNEIVKKGITHYWQISPEYGVKDLVGDKDLHGEIHYTEDKDSNAESALHLNGQHNIFFGRDEGIFSGDFTFCTWLNLDTPMRDRMRIFGKSYGQISEIYIDMDRNMYLIILGSQKIVARIELNRWFHICYALNGFNATAHVDGILMNSVMWAVKMNRNPYEWYDIGKNQEYGLGGYTKMKFSDMIFYNRGLNSDEIKQIRDLPANVERQFIKRN